MLNEIVLALAFQVWVPKYVSLEDKTTGQGAVTITYGHSETKRLNALFKITNDSSVLRHY